MNGFSTGFYRKVFFSAKTHYNIRNSFLRRSQYVLVERVLVLCCVPVKSKQSPRGFELLENQHSNSPIPEPNSCSNAPTPGKKPSYFIQFLIYNVIWRSKLFSSREKYITEDAASVCTWYFKFHTHMDEFRMPGETSSVDLCHDLDQIPA